MILKRIKYTEHHENGQLKIAGEIGIVSELSKHLYDTRKEWPGLEGKPVVRLGIWTKFFDNGQVGWQIDYGDGMHDSKSERRKFPSYRKDGALISE